MILSELLKTISASTLSLSDEKILTLDVKHAFSSDLMSDCLALLDGDTSDMVLLTGLCNAQSIRTAEMLDLPVIIFVRGKVLSEEDLAIAREKELNLFTTNLTMYEASALLYNEGVMPPGK